MVLPHTRTRAIAICKSSASSAQALGIPRNQYQPALEWPATIRGSRQTHQQESSIEPLKQPSVQASVRKIRCSIQPIKSWHRPRQMVGSSGYSAVFRSLSMRLGGLLAIQFLLRCFFLSFGSASVRSRWETILMGRNQVSMLLIICCRFLARSCESLRLLVFFVRLYTKGPTRMRLDEAWLSDSYSRYCTINLFIPVGDHRKPENDTQIQTQSPERNGQQITPRPAGLPPKH